MDHPGPLDTIDQQNSVSNDPATCSHEGMLQISIIEKSDKWANLSDLHDEIAVLAKRTLEFSGIKLSAPQHVTIVLMDDHGSHQLNKTYRGIDKPTNVLSFPAPPMTVSPRGDDTPLGDIVLAAETLIREASEFKRTVKDHTLHLTVHGLLHLLGFDHETEEDAERMEGLETQILLDHGLHDPYADD